MNDGDLLRTRQSLLQRLKNLDDQASWQDFFNTYWKLIYGVARKAGLTDAEAQDAVQEAVITVVKKIRDFEVDRGRGSFKAWLLQITRWRIADQFRKRPPLAHSPEHGPDETSRTPTSQRIPDPSSIEFDQVWEQEWEQNLFHTAVEKVRATVDPAHFQIFDLRIRKQLPAATVAAKLEVKVAHVYFATEKVSRLIKKEVDRLRSSMG